MRKLCLVALIASFCILSYQAQGQCSKNNSTNCAYITNLAGREILAVDRTTPGVAISIATLASNRRPQDATVGPDNRIYVCLPENNQIVRMKLDGSNVETIYSGINPTGPQGPRFSVAGDLYVNSPSGVWRIGGISKISSGGPFPAPVQLTSAVSSSVGGLAFAANGDLLIAANNKVLVSPAIASVPTGTTQELITTSGAISGLAVNSIGDIVIASGSDITRYFNCTVANSIWSCQSQTLASFAPDHPVYIESIPDTLAVGNSGDDLVFVSTADAANLNGKVWRVNAAGGKTLLASLTTKVQGKLVPAIGMAVPASARVLTKSFDLAHRTNAFHFGPYSFEVTNSLDPLAADSSLDCDVALTAQQESPAAINQILADSGIAGSAVGFDGEEGWITSFHVAKPPCFATISQVGPAGFFQFLNPRLIRIPDDYPASPATVTQTAGFYPSGPLTGVPGDPIIINRSATSKFVLANVALTNTYHFCGFLPPVNDPGPLSQFNSGRNITFKFQLRTAPNCGGSLITDGQAALVKTVLSVAQLAPGFERKLVDPSGDSIKEPPTFKYDANGDVFVFTADSTGWALGTYEATVVSDSFQLHSVRFLLVK